MKTTRKPRYAELTATRLLGEQRWAYERHLEHMNYRDMRRLVIEPVDRGGLGYDLSEHALRGLVVGYVESARETLTEERGVYIARELADLDLQHRALAAVLARSIDAAESAKVAAALGYDSLAQLLKEAPDAAVPLDARQITALLRELRAVGESRRKLLGLDAPLEARVEVTSRDGVMAELEAMLAGNDDLSTKRKAKR
jgi:hypothetical protein